MRQGLNLIKSNALLRQNTSTSSGMPKKNSNVAGVVAKKRLGEEMISRVEDLPALPTVVSNIMTLIEDERSNAKNFDKYLRQDQALTARLLRIVNSSFFGLRNKINSIPQAIVLIGYNSLKNLVLAASTSKVLEGAFPGYGFKANGLWQHSFMAATWSKKVAPILGFDMESCEELFVAGLLHDVGKLVLASYITENCKEMIVSLIKSNGNIEDAERAVVGIDHSEIGSRIAQKWNFSSKLATIIKYHHRLDNAYEYHKEIALVHLVNHLILSGKFGLYENFPINSDFSESTIKHLGIDYETINKIQEDINASAEKWDYL